jgi:hypothetical protein
VRVQSTAVRVVPDEISPAGDPPPGPRPGVSVIGSHLEKLAALAYHADSMDTVWVKPL